MDMLGKLDPNSSVALKLKDQIIGTLYNTISHPPSAFLGPSKSYREADGSWNCLHDPNLGRAGTTYARSVQGKSGLPRHSLPDPGLIFDTILKRRDVRPLYAHERKKKTVCLIIIGQNPPGRDVQHDICVCVNRDPFPVPHRS